MDRWGMGSREKDGSGGRPAACESTSTSTSASASSTDSRLLCVTDGCKMKAWMWTEFEWADPQDRGRDG